MAPSLKASSSCSSISRPESPASHTASTSYAPPSPPTSSHASSASSSRVSLEMADEENVTITAANNRSLTKRLGKKKSQEEDLRLLAVSAQMTELSYGISDIQTRIFEIQELRHKSQSTSDTAGTTNVIDQSLMSLDERLDAVTKGIKSVNEALEPLLQSTATPTVAANGDSNENAGILRKHAALLAEWEAVQDESDVLREELKEDKWLTVFRTVTDQADGMMSSLEKAVNRCQEFIWQVHRRGGDDSIGSVNSSRSDKPPLIVSVDVYNTLLDSFEAKKKHYMPATTKVLAIIDKGVHDRVTKNGETLRRHAESVQRWKTLRERITKTDAEMENVRRILIHGEKTPSEAGSSASGHTSLSRSGYLATPPSGQRASRTPSSSSLSRSISPLRKFARKITGSRHSPAPPVTPLRIDRDTPAVRSPASEPVRTMRKQRSSIFGLRGSPQAVPLTPDRPSHKHSQSLTPDQSPRSNRAELSNTTIKGKSSRPTWNSSTKVEVEDRTQTLRGTPPRRTPSALAMYGSPDDIPPVPALGATYRRSLSRTSMASSRPWSPVTSSYSTSQSSYHPPMPSFRPPSRTAQSSSHIPPRSITPSVSAPMTPRPRAKTPSHIPAPAKWRSFSGGQSESGWDEQSQRAFSPAFSATSGMDPTSPGRHPPRPPSRSMIPVPSVQLSTPSRPGSSMSRYRSESPSVAAFRSSATRAQTPETTLRKRASQVPIYQGPMTPTPLGGTTRSVRPSIQGKLPPSSFRDGASSSSRAPSRSGSRAGAYTPTLEGGPVHEYVCGNSRDPLDVEVASIVNSIPHGLLVERVDPPLRGAPREGEEVKAQYAFSNALSRKVVTCKLTTLTRTSRAGATGDAVIKKVMCRVGGGWQDLQLYMLNRQAGM
ncbi:hypothetical protein HGRIS_004975 [Hohenbuehelia grisea]|uniref:GAR domain-containing protein n=1 Tax=Hohenbuehelia grisea TaxID=104357 RepID=A0ABR3JDL0_9AGAR